MRANVIWGICTCGGSADRFFGLIGVPYANGPAVQPECDKVKKPSF